MISKILKVIINFLKMCHCLCIGKRKKIKYKVNIKLIYSYFQKNDILI